MMVKRDDGYTIVEVLVALVLLFLVLTPATFVLTQLLTTVEIADKKNAITICINVAEKALLHGNISSATEEQLVNNRSYTIIQRLENYSNGLRLYKVTVSRHNRILSELHHILPDQDLEK